MQTTLKTRIIKIGNSLGICIPKAFLAQAGLDDEVELDVQPNQIVIRPARPRRHGWAKQFSAMGFEGHDDLRDEMTATNWDKHEWE